MSGVRMERKFTKSKISIFARDISSLSSSSTLSSSPSSLSSSISSKDLYIDANTGFELENADNVSSSVNIYLSRKPNAVERVIIEESYCFDVKRFSEKFVDAIVEEAHNYLHAKKFSLLSSDVIEPLIDDIINVVVEPEPSSRSMENTWPFSSPTATETVSDLKNYNFEWPKISQFNIKLGLERLEDYVNTWQRSPEWLFSVEFLGFESETCSNIFVYEVEWSKPTNIYPIPQVTANVYFGLEVFKIVPPNFDRDINVTYVFEASSVIHVPGRIDFQEKWLQDIVDAKLKIFKTLTFSVPPKNVCPSYKRSVRNEFFNNSKTKNKN